MFFNEKVSENLEEQRRQIPSLDCQVHLKILIWYSQKWGKPAFVIWTLVYILQRASVTSQNIIAWGHALHFIAKNTDKETTLVIRYFMFHFLIIPFPFFFFLSIFLLFFPFPNHSFMVCILVWLSSFGLSPIPMQAHFMANASRYLGWLTAKTTGFRQDAILAKNAGNWETKGVTRVRSPKQEIMQTIA